MRVRFQQFIALTRLTAIETIRQPVCLILITTAILLIGHLPILITHTLGEGIKLIRDSSLAIHFVSGLLLGAYAACASFVREIRRGTAASVLSKPINRELFFLAKFTGIVIVLICFSAVVTVATLLSARTVRDRYVLDWWSMGTLLAAVVAAYGTAGLMSYFLRRPFSSNAFVMLILLLATGFVGVNFLDVEGDLATFGTQTPWSLVPASVLVAIGVLVLAAISASLATRLDMVATLTICSVLFFLGLLSDYLFGRLATTGSWGRTLYGLIPNWQHFWVVDALGEETGIPWSYLTNAGVYGLLYIAGVLCLGMVAFRHMDVRV